MIAFRHTNGKWVPRKPTPLEKGFISQGDLVQLVNHPILTSSIEDIDNLSVEDVLGMMRERNLLWRIYKFESDYDEPEEEEDEEEEVVEYYVKDPDFRPWSNSAHYEVAVGKVEFLTEIIKSLHKPDNLRYLIRKDSHTKAWNQRVHEIIKSLHKPDNLRYLIRKDSHTKAWNQRVQLIRKRENDQRQRLRILEGLLFRLLAQEMKCPVKEIPFQTAIPRDVEIKNQWANTSKSKSKEAKKNKKRKAEEIDGNKKEGRKDGIDKNAKVDETQSRKLLKVEVSTAKKESTINIVSNKSHGTTTKLDEKKAEATASKPSNIWSCPSCTFDNKLPTTRCRICK